MQTILKPFLAALLLAFLSATALADDSKPSATLTVEEEEIGFIITGNWGHGTLDYDGKQYKFKMGGAKIGGMGVTKVKADGEVYHLNDLQDFPGTYGKVEAGLDVVKGKEGAWLKNAKGVVIHMHSEDAQGIALEVGLEGLEIKLED